MKHKRLHHQLLFIVAAVLISYGSSSIIATLPKTSNAAVSQHTMLYDAKSGSNFEIYRYNSDFTSSQLTNNGSYDSWWPKISPNGQKILFYRSPAGMHDTDHTKTSLWTMNADGNNQQEIISNGENSWQVHGHGEWSPDSSRILMFAGTGGTIVVHTDASGNDIQLVQTMGQWNAIDPSWSPDGQSVVYIYQGEVWKVPKIPNGSSPIRLTNDSLTDYDPYFSPDGMKIAFLTTTSPNPSPSGSWGIRIMNADGSGLHTAIDDGNINSKPEWSPDGSLIYFHRFIYGDADQTFSTWYIKTDGSGLTKITTNKPWSEYPDLITSIRASPTNGVTPGTTPPSTPASTTGATSETKKFPTTSATTGSGSTTPTMDSKTTLLNAQPYSPQQTSTTNASANPEASDVSTKNHKLQMKLLYGLVAVIIGIASLICAVALRKRHRRTVAATAATKDTTDVMKRISAPISAKRGK